MSRLVINGYHRKNRINKNIYGHFTEHLGRCIYEGIYVGENSGIPNEKGMRKDVVSALREIRVPVLRWPGGNFADEYHWMDGIGTRSERRRTINTHWEVMWKIIVLEHTSFLSSADRLAVNPI